MKSSIPINVMQQTTLNPDANNADAQKHNFAHIAYVPAKLSSSLNKGIVGIEAYYK